MGRKLLGTVLVVFFLYVIALIARDNLSLDDWTAGKGDDETPLGDSEVEA